MLNYKLFAIAFVFTFTAMVPSTFASAPQTKIETYPNKGCLRVVGVYGKHCKVQAIVEGKGPVEWKAVAEKQDENGRCEDGNIKIRQDGRVQMGKILMVRVRFDRIEGVDAPVNWSLCVPRVKGAGRGK